MFAINLPDICLLLVIIFHLFCCPYTKVEESFNMQAVFDLLTFGPLRLDYFDHLQFPGVVPRTFLGAIVIGIVSFPFHTILFLAGISGHYQQILVRFVLGLLCWIAFTLFRNATEEKFGVRVGQLLSTLTMIQFHICFYMSRSLPNTFALISCLIAYSFWLKVMLLLLLYKVFTLMSIQTDSA